MIKCCFSVLFGDVLASVADIDALCLPFRAPALKVVGLGGLGVFWCVNIVQLPVSYLEVSNEWEVVAQCLSFILVGRSIDLHADGLQHLSLYGIDIEYLVELFVCVGIIVMIFGYLLFACVFAAGQYLANLEHSAVWSDESISAWRTWTTVGGTVLAGLMGLGMIRAGSLSGKCKYWKRKKMKNKKLANDRHAN